MDLSWYTLAAAAAMAVTLWRRQWRTAGFLGLSLLLSLFLPAEW